MRAFVPAVFGSSSWPLVSRGIAVASALALTVTLMAWGGAPASGSVGSGVDNVSSKPRDWSAVGAWDGLTAPDAIGAAALARLRDEAVEDLSQRTESTQTYALPDGQWRTDMAMGPEWVPTGEDPTTEAGWAALDTDLVHYSDGTYRTRAHPGALVFSGPDSGRVLVASGTNADGNGFELWFTGTLPKPVVEGDAIRYVDAEPGMDLVFFVTATGYEQFFVAKNEAALQRADVLMLEYVSPDDRLKEHGDGFVVTGEDGDAVAQTGAVEVWDADEDAKRVHPVLAMALPKGSPAPEPAIGDSAPPETVVIDADTTVEGDTGTVLIDTDDVPVGVGTEFPVVIDPSVSLSLSFDTYVSSVTTVDKSTNTELLVGTPDSGSGKYRAFFNVNVSPIIGKKVSKATLSLYNHHSWSCTAKSWEVWSTGTTSTSTRWSNMPSLSTKYATSTATKGYSSSCGDAYVSADITTLATAWAGQSTTTKGVAVKATSETDNFSWKRFYSGNNATNKPKISVTYNSYPNTPSGVKVGSTTPAAGAVVYTNDTTPTFSALVKDPDGGNARGRFTVTTGSTVITTKAAGHSVASGSTSSYTTATLAQGKAYAVEVWGNDGSLDSKASIKPTWTVYVDTIAPGTTGIASTQFTNGEWKDTAPASVSATLSATDAVKFEYKIDDGAAKTIAAATGNAVPGSAVVDGLPRTIGGHVVEARAVDRAGNTGEWGEFEYGIGQTALTSPTLGETTLDIVRVVASSQPDAAGAIERSLQWRESGSESAWQSLAQLADVPAGENPAVDYQWSTATTAIAAGKRFEPFMMDIQVCFTYTSTDETLCTWGDDEDSQAFVVRDPNAFGGHLPVVEAGPGQVALWSGEFATSATDIAVPGYGGNLTVSRVYSSQTTGTESSVFGPGWSASFDGPSAGLAGLTVVDTTTDDGLLTLEGADGTRLVYRHQDSQTTPQPVGPYTAIDEDTALAGLAVRVVAEGVSKVLEVTDDVGVVTRWNYEGASTWLAGAVVEPGDTGVSSFTHDGAGRLTRILAPVPEGLPANSCDGGSFVAGCRAIYVEYYDSTGTDGSYTGRVASLTYRAWDPEAGGVDYLDVATYRYTDEGLLQEVTDERNGLGVQYAYSNSSVAPVPLLTSVTPGGLAQWHLHYDADGRLERVSRDAATAGGQPVTTARFITHLDASSPAVGLPNAPALSAAWGQGRTPTKGFAVFGQGEDPGATVDADEWRNAQLYYTDGDGYTVNTAEFGAGRWLLTSLEYDSLGNVVRTLDAAATDYLSDLSANNDGAPVEVDEVNAVATITRFNDAVVADEGITYEAAGETEVQVIEAGTELFPAGMYVTDEWAPSRDDGSGQRRRIHAHYAYDEGAPNSGISPLTGFPFGLATSVTQTTAVATSGTWDLGAAVATGEPILAQSRMGYAPASGDVLGDTSGWTLFSPTVTTLDMGDDADITTTIVYDASGSVVQTVRPRSNGTDAGTQLTFYYTVEANPAAPQCGGPAAAKWAGLVCLTTTAETIPTVASQFTSGYSMLGAPTDVVESLSGVVRHTSVGYLSDGRVDTTTISVNGLATSIAQDATRIEYDETTGLPVATVTFDGAVETGGVSTDTDLWARPVAYTDLDGQQSSYAYDAKGRLASVVDPVNTVTYGYDGTDAVGNTERRSLGTSMTIAGVGTFTAAYDASGNTTVQTMPGGITQSLSYTLTGEPVALAYTTLDEDDETVPLLGWEQVSDLYGRVVAESTPTAGNAPDAIAEYSRGYEYDRAGRLVTVQDRTAVLGETVELPGGENTVTPCVTRSYEFDVRGNRLARATSVSGTDGECTTVGAVVESWAHDDADRVQTGANLTGQYQYDELGRQLVIPGIDSPMGAAAGNVQFGYYDSDLVASLTQGSTTTTFDLDPLLRRAASATTEANETTSVVRHYADASDAPAWVVATDAEGVASTTWYGSSLAGDLGVTVTDGVTTVQLADLHGDFAIPVTLDAGVVAAIGGYSDFDEYGRPLEGTSSPGTGGVSYGWLGGKERATDESTRLMLMGVRLYNPNTGLFTSIDPVPGGNTTAYAYPQDPINMVDLDGRQSGLPGSYYGYRFAYMLNSNSKQVTPALLMTNLLKNFLYFPTSTCRTMSLGKTCNLAGGNPVSMIHQSAASFKFVSLRGHAEGAGRFITFTIVRDSKTKKLVLVVQAWALAPGGPNSKNPSKWVNERFLQGLWAGLAQNLNTIVNAIVLKRKLGK